MPIRLTARILTLLALAMGCAPASGPNPGFQTGTNDGAVPKADNASGPGTTLSETGGPATTTSGADVSGNVSGDWCGTVNLTGPVTVPAGQTLTICAGAMIKPAQTTPPVLIDVQGTLAIRGTASAHVSFGDADGRWTGLKVAGVLDAAFAEISGGTNCLQGLTGSQITFNDSKISACAQTLTLANGGTLDRTQILGGSSVLISGGILHMTDSTVDLLHAAAGPDCTVWGGGGAVLDHVHFTGCHCPIHIGLANLGFTATHSIFDQAGVPVMIAGTHATFSGNQILGSPAFQDIGGSISANIGGNYFGGGKPTISTSNMLQFSGAEVYSTAPLAGVGPR